MPEEFGDGWTNAWLQKGFRPIQNAVYKYQDVNGNDVVRKTRFTLLNVTDGKNSGQKTFIVQHRLLQSVILGADAWKSGVGKEGWETDLLYRRVALEEGIASGQTVYLCEGEKDADAVARWGGCSTTHYQGAAGMRKEQAAVLAGAERVKILADRDVTGYQLAYYHIQLLKAAGMPLDRIQVRLPAVEKDKADISDHIAAGYGPGDTVSLLPRELASLIKEHGTLRTGGARRWGYAYGGNADEAGQEWKVNDA